MENPYWHDKYKPHQINQGEIRLLCFEIQSIVAASMGRQGSGIIEEEGGEDVEVEFSLLHKLCFEMTEAELSKRLLRLALLVRTFDDTFVRGDETDDYVGHRTRIDAEYGPFGDVYEGSESITNSLRECSNKIIHAEDVRPVYETEDDRDDPKAMWGMNGTLELEGIQNKQPWKIGIYVAVYLEGVLALIEFAHQ